LFIKVQEPVIGGTILRPINKMLSFPIRTNIERTVSTIVATSVSIVRRRKPKKYP